MSYVALYREWRPQTFEEIVGQEHISRTLLNGLKMRRVAHAYLFCGPRGTGKTTTAKVLAKALNCLAPLNFEPCNKCENCKRVNEGSSMDVMEIDAASNRGIDEIRDLREKVKFAPTEGNYRVYIIDEVHMLTTEAFNALLKTLEEPPAHVIFILATTEPHKIPMTVLSRCQRFDFRSIRLDDIIGRLKTVVNDLGISIAEEALALIARTAEGGMRDALSVLDQCISFGGSEVSVEDVNCVIGTASTEFFLNMAQCFKAGDTTLALKLVDDLVRQGKDIRQFTKDLTRYFRNLLLVEVCHDVEDLVLVSPEALTAMKGLELGKSKIISLIELFTGAEREMKWTSQPRLGLELAVIKASDKSQSIDPTGLMERLSRLEEIVSVNQGGGIDSLRPPKELADTHRSGLSGTPKKEYKGAAKKGTADAESELSNKAGETKNTVEIETVMKLWQEILNRIKKTKMSARAFLLEGEPVQVVDGSLVLSFPIEYGFHKEKVEQSENKKAIEQALKEVTGASLKLKCMFSDEVNKKAGIGLPKDNDSDSDPLVEEAIKLFGGEVIAIED